MSAIVKRIRAELKDASEESARSSYQRFFKEEVRFHGVKTGTVKAIANRYWKEIKPLGKREIFGLCEELYRSGYCEEAFVVSYWVPKLAGAYEPEDLATFRRWIDTYIDNWAECDGFCNHSVGSFLTKFPDSAPEVAGWAGSDNRWLKRAAAVSFIVPAKQREFLDDVFEIADRLLSDPDDLVRKGYGWLLKEASRKHRQEVLDYVVRNRAVMPRTALRYAIELMPDDLRREAMQRV